MVDAKYMLYKMRIFELNNIVNTFELKTGCRKKENIVDIVYKYMKDNISDILCKLIISEEINVLRGICDNNFEAVYDEENINIEHVKSLAAIGMLHIDKEKNIIVIPEEFQMQMKLSLEHKCLDKFAENRTGIIKMVNDMLEVYGIFHLEILEDYITGKIGRGYRVHETIKFIRKYNLRNRFFYEDEDCFFYNLKVEKRESMKMRVLDVGLNYKYYNELEMAEVLDRECAYEKDVKIILNRVFKNLKSSDEIVKAIKVMIIEGKSSEEIGLFLKTKVKRLSDFGYKSILKSVDNMKNSHIIWGYKGYYLEEIDDEMMA